MSNYGADNPGLQAVRTQVLEAALQRWAADRERVISERDDLVRTAYANGVNKHRIHTLSGIARTTIDEILTAETTTEGH